MAWQPIGSISGPQGVQGVRGTNWIRGNGPPTTTTAPNPNELDYYLNIATGAGRGDIWVYENGTWTNFSNVIGPQGIQGVRGTNWYRGTGNPGTISGQRQDDLYFDQANGAIWLRGATAWTQIANITGPMPAITYQSIMPVVPLFAPRVVYFKAPGTGTYNVPSDVRAIYVEVVGGGAGGRNSLPTVEGESSFGAGGSAGGYAAAQFPYVDADPAKNYPLLGQYDFQVGAGGLPNANGEQSWFGPLWPDASSGHMIAADGGYSAPTQMLSGSVPAIASAMFGGHGHSPPYGYFEQGMWGGHGVRVGGQIGWGGKGATSYFSLNESANKDRVHLEGWFHDGEGFPANGAGGGGSGALAFGRPNTPEENAARTREDFSLGFQGGAGYQGIIRIWEYL